MNFKKILLSIVFIVLFAPCNLFANHFEKYSAVLNVNTVLKHSFIMFNPADLNFTENFETESDWTFTNGDLPNKWTIGTGAFNGAGSTKGLFISNDAAANTYTTSTSSTTVHAVKEIGVLPADISEAVVSFDWRCMGEGSSTLYDYFRVWIVPATFTPVYGTQITAANGVQFGGSFNQNPNWQTANLVANISAYAGQNVKLVFEWKNDGSGGTQPPAAIDNVLVQGIVCSAPHTIVVTNVTNASMTYTWQAGAAETSWEVIHQLSTLPAPTAGTAGTIVTEATYTANTLTANTSYNFYVRAVCSATEKSFWVNLSNRYTQCNTLPVPFQEGFNSDSTTENCWTVVNGNNDTDVWDMNYTTNSFEGDQVAMLNTDNNNGDNDDWLISPTLNLSATPGAKRLKFHYRVQSQNEPNDFRVLLSTTGAAPVSFTNILIPLATYNNTTYVEKIVNLLDANGQPFVGEVNIAFHVPQGGVDGWRLFIDNVIVEDIPPCPDITNLEVNVSCEDPTTATVSWTAGAFETSWEYAITAPGAPTPTNGTVTNENIIDIEGLVQGDNYVVWVRGICGDEFSEWVSLEFTSKGSPVSQAQPFCADDSGGILFPNISDEDNAEEYGGLACLGSTPNPVWYYLTVAQSGDLNFQIVQNTQFDENGNPIGDGLDVDFIAWGPFDNMPDACSTIDLENPTQNMVDCSYSSAPIENFDITNAQIGQVYVLLITNFNGDPGWIKLEQTNPGEPGAGQTDCSFLCEVDLGDDITVCEGTEVVLTAETLQTGGQPGQENNITAIRWYKDNVLMDPNQYNELEITVTESGTYRVEVVKDNCSEEFNADEVVVKFVKIFNGEILDKIELCDNDVDFYETFDLDGYLQGLTVPAQFNVSIHETAANASANAAPISGNYTSQEKTVYVRIESKELTSCYVIYELNLILLKADIPTNIPGDQIICNLYALPKLLPNQKYTKYELKDVSGNVLSTNSEINIDELLKPGFYTVYIETVSNDGCVAKSQFNVDVMNCVIPKGISPNGDGENDYLDLVNYWVQDIKIFNRYGKEVYSYGVGYTTQWNGQDNNGNLLPTGTYYYKIITPYEQFTGYIYIAREVK